nr:MAG TPA: hypothetical protein [Caudoviricetes sp.]
MSIHKFKTLLSLLQATVKRPFANAVVFFSKLLYK